MEEKPVRSRFIILPDEENSKEALRKAIANSIVDPRKRLFNEYRAAGLDSETAAELSDLRSMDSAAQAETVLQAAVNERNEYPAAAISRSVVQEVPQAVSNVFGTAGAAFGSALGLAVLKETVKHSKPVLTTGLAVVGIISAVAVGKFVAAATGKALGVLAAVNVLSASGLIVFAFLRRRLP